MKQASLFARLLERWGMAFTTINLPQRREPQRCHTLPHSVHSTTYWHAARSNRGKHCTHFQWYLLLSKGLAHHSYPLVAFTFGLSSSHLPSSSRVSMWKIAFPQIEITFLFLASSILLFSAHFHNFTVPFWTLQTSTKGLSAISSTESVISMLVTSSF